ncbi:MAG: PAS domain S-box protein [Anaerolineaceae bacterium]|nr:PAS domain S-box protein [Anaerolineaceae bacterium]
MDKDSNSGHARRLALLWGDNFAWEVIEALGQGVAILGADGRFEYVNPAYAQMVARAPEVLVGLSPFAVTHPDDHKKLHRARRQRLLGEPSTYEIRLVRPDGTPVYALVTGVPHWEADRVSGAFTIITDLTEHKRAEEALKQSEARYRSTLDNMMEGCQIIGFDWRYLYVNNTVVRQGQQTEAELLGRTMMEAYPGIEQTELFTVLKRCMHERVATQMENEFVFPNGSRGWFELSIQPVPEGIFILSFDITERKRVEEALRQSEAQLQHIIDTVPEGVLLVANDGTVRLTNPVADQFLKILASDLTDTCLTRLGNRPLSELLTSPPTKGLWHEIIQDERIFEAIARPVEIGAENSGWVLILLDVTQERDIQKRVQRQERLAAVGQLAAGIAHDFNNIMAVITLYAQILSRTVELPPRAQERLSTINEQAHRATDLIQQILDFSRQSVLERQPLDLLPFMKELVKLLDRTLPEHIEVKLNDTEAEYLIQADPSRIQQVIMNLAINARDAMPDGGQLTISLAQVQTEKQTPLFTRNMPPGDWIQLQVADNGSGIPQQVLPKILEPFFTTKEIGQGTGLGLAQVYGIIQQHEGYIDVKTEVEQGTTFSLYFPTLAADEAVVSRLDTTLLQYGQGERILLIEDDLATRQAVVDSLTLLNYEVIEASNGREALSILETKAKDISLVLSDAVMPEMGGIALLYAMRQRNLTIPVILLTGHPLNTLNKQMTSLQPLGLRGWLPKPPNLEKLSQLLAQVLADSLS